QPRSGSADMVVETDIDDRRAQRQLIEHFADDLEDAPCGVGLAVGDLAEQDVVLQRGGGVVAVGIEEFDLVLRLLRQLAAERAARLQKALLQRRVEDIETVARGDQLERQRQQLGPLVARQRLGSAAALRRRQDGAEFRQIAGADKAELLEKFVLGR